MYISDTTSGGLLCSVQLEEGNSIFTFIQICVWIMLENWRNPLSTLISIAMNRMNIMLLCIPSSWARAGWLDATYTITLPLYHKLSKDFTKYFSYTCSEPTIRFSHYRELWYKVTTRSLEQSNLYLSNILCERLYLPNICKFSGWTMKTKPHSYSKKNHIIWAVWGSEVIVKHNGWLGIKCLQLLPGSLPSLGSSLDILWLM